MKVALFFNDQILQVGIYDNSISKKIKPNPKVRGLKSLAKNLIYKSGGKKIAERIEYWNNIVFPMSPKLLFQNSHNFKDRLLYLIHANRPELEDTKIEELSIAVNGFISEDGSTLIESELMNQISMNGLFNGLNIKKTFAGSVNQNKTRFVSDIQAICSGLITGGYIEQLPCLVIYIHKNVNFALIDEDEFVEVLNIGNWPIEKLENKTPSYLLGSIGVDEIILSDKVNIYAHYTKRLGDIIKHFGSFFKDLQTEPKSICVFSNDDYLIQQEKLCDRFKKTDLIFPDSPEDRALIAIDGCFSVASEPLEQLKVKKVEYWSNNELVDTFKKKADFIDHWKMWNQTANPKNIYKVYGQDRLLNIYKLSDIKYEFVAKSIFN